MLRASRPISAVVCGGGAVLRAQEGAEPSDVGVQVIGGVGKQQQCLIERNHELVPFSSRLLPPLPLRADRPSYPPYDNGGGASPYARKDTRVDVPIARTPSPTPSEERELKSGVFDWKTMSKWRFWIRKEWTWYYVAFVIVMVLFGLITIYHDQIVEWMRPLAEFLRDDLSYGWVIPIAVLFVISFPPLFGHEIVAVLCGLVWGLWIGFGIVAAGTFIGEVGNFYAFKYCCRARGEKLERTKISYACLAKVVRDGGFKIALIARLSAIPGHFTTAVFSTCGMGIIVFSLAALLSMPKQLITVYLGVILDQASEGTQTKESKIISDVVLGVTVVLTFVAMWYIYRQMGKVKPQIIYERRKARQEKMMRAVSEGGPYNNSNLSHQSSLSLSDESGIPLTSPRAQGYPASVMTAPSSSTVALAAPQPYHQYGNMNGSTISRERIPTYRQDSGGINGYDTQGLRHTAPRESMDNVAWDMGVRRQDAYDPHRPRYNTPYDTSLYPLDTDLHHRRTASPSRGYVGPEMAQTPTQPLSSPYHATVPRRPSTPDQLPSPFDDPPVTPRHRQRHATDPDDQTPESPFADPSPAPWRGQDLAHAQEETYASYHTAREPSATDASRQQSPPPPAYTVSR
ncbi:hypothetical protein BD626DRAFT_486358 [Schizophyllum amplum]|uniref:Golgi apparatus membrane protein TVP38 n=1 Tax=Schizophyllum amplum TaxID=97359 RepID=A0A550CMF8_9AGAR|nr:hypothetical protein BD626DRAFT_486358 [Auriculariopsis ampla]